jgi:hypothetical protein
MKFLSHWPVSDLSNVISDVLDRVNSFAERQQGKSIARPMDTTMPAV